jgi:hypothetical protein
MDDSMKAAIETVKASRARFEEPAEPETAEPEAVETVEEPAAVEAAPPAVEEPAPRPSKAISEWAALELKNRREREALERERAEVKAATDRNAELMRLAKEDPRRYLSESGLDLEALTKQIVEGKKVDPVQERLDALEKRLADEQAAKEAESKSAEQRRIDSAMEAELTSLRAWFEPQAEAYPYLVAVSDGDAAVVADAIQKIRIDTWRKSGGKELLDEAVIAGRLEEQWKKRFERVQQAKAPPAAPAATPPTTIGRKHVSKASPPSKLSGKDRALARLKEAAAAKQ